MWRCILLSVLMISSFPLRAAIDVAIESYPPYFSAENPNDSAILGRLQHILSDQVAFKFTSYSNVKKHLKEGTAATVHFQKVTAPRILSASFFDVQYVLVTKNELPSIRANSSLLYQKKGITYFTLKTLMPNKHLPNVTQVFSAYEATTRFIKEDFDYLVIPDFVAKSLFTKYFSGEMKKVHTYKPRYFKPQSVYFTCNTQASFCGRAINTIQGVHLGD